MVIRQYRKLFYGTLLALWNLLPAPYKDGVEGERIQFPSAFNSHHMFVYQG